MKKTVTLCLLMAIASLTLAQNTGFYFDDPEFELRSVFNDCFVKTAVTVKSDIKKAKYTHAYEITHAAVIIYEHTVFGTSAVDATYADKWFYIPLNDLYLSTKETTANVFTESTEITLTNKLHSVMAGNGTKYNLADESSYLQTAITFPFTLNSKTYANTLEYLNTALSKLRNEGKDIAEKEVVSKKEEVKPTIKKEYSGTYLIESTMVNGKKEGTQKIYYENGRIRAASNFINDKEEGVSKIYYESGELEYETPFSNNKKEGVEKGYYKNGKIKSTMIFVKGEANGLIKNFYENGNLKSELEALNGVRNGYDTQYDKNGKIEEKQYWVNGKLSGTLAVCEGIDFLIKKLKNKEYKELDDNVWMRNNFDGIKNFEYDYFSKGSFSAGKITAFLNKPNQCVLTYLPGFKGTMYSVYKQLVAELNTCKNLGDGEEPEQSGGKMATFRYDKKTVVTITASEYKGEIRLTVSRTAEKD